MNYIHPLAKNSDLREKFSKLALKRAENFNLDKISNIWFNTIVSEI